MNFTDLEIGEIAVKNPNLLLKMNISLDKVKEILNLGPRIINDPAVKTICLHKNITKDFILNYRKTRTNSITISKALIANPVLESNDLDYIYITYKDKAVIHNPNCSSNLLERIYENEKPISTIKEIIFKHPNLRKEYIEDLWKPKNYISYLVLYSPNCPSYIIEDIMRMIEEQNIDIENESSIEIFCLILANPNTPPSFIQKFIETYLIPSKVRHTTALNFIKSILSNSKLESNIVDSIKNSTHYISLYIESDYADQDFLTRKFFSSESRYFRSDIIKSTKCNPSLLIYSLLDFKNEILTSSNCTPEIWKLAKIIA